VTVLKIKTKQMLTVVEFVIKHALMDKHALLVVIVYQAYVQVESV
jgi:hypothetical protein